MRYPPSPTRFQRLNTDEIRANFLLENLFEPDEVVLNYWDVDRTIVGSAVPTGGALPLETGDELIADYFTQRREVGVLNTGGDGHVEVDGERYDMAPRDILYVGRGSEDVTFHSSDGASAPSRFYLMSYPAHETHPTAHMTKNDANLEELGEQSAGSRRDLYQYVHPGGLQSAQLVMGITEVAEGNVWNTMPTHTHERRSEVYMYFGLESDEVVFHLMGEPQETRSIVVRDGEAALSPSWSIHGGAGTGNYTFCWAMGGENQSFDDMQGVAMEDIR